MNKPLLTPLAALVAVFLLCTAYLMVPLPWGRTHDIKLTLSSFTASAEDTIPLRRLIGERWALVCATTEAFGEVLAETDRDKAAVRRIVDSASFFDTEVTWRLSVFENEGGAPLTYTLSRRQHPFIDGPYIAKNEPHLVPHGRPILCTSQKDVVLMKLRTKSGTRAGLTLVEL